MSAQTTSCTLNQDCEQRSSRYGLCRGKGSHIKSKQGDLLLGLLNEAPTIPFMNVDLGIWNKLTKVVAYLMVAAAVMAVGISYLPLIQDNEQMRKAIQATQSEIALEKIEVAKLEARVDALSHDPKAVEREAREVLGFAKPGETVIRFE